MNEFIDNLVYFLKKTREMLDVLNNINRGVYSFSPDKYFSFDDRDMAQKLLIEGESLISECSELKSSRLSLDMDISRILNGHFFLDLDTDEEQDHQAEYRLTRIVDSAEYYKRAELTRSFRETLAELNRIRRILIRYLIYFRNLDV